VTRLALAAVLLSVVAGVTVKPARAETPGAETFDPYAFVKDAHQIAIAKMIVRFFEDASRPVPFEISTGSEFASRKAAVRQRLLDAIGLNPLPERVALDVHQSDALEHPWCSVRKVHYQIWPGIYTEAFLYVPKDAGDRPRPVILSMTGHWPNGKAHADEQKRCLNFARLGYVVLAPDANHYEDLPIGISHQTHMVWSNVRCLDLIETLPGIDKDRIGACGGSGGGYQAQMLLALDERIKAATIMGFTCDYRETLFPHVGSCTCVHFPGAVAIANMPEVSALGMPTPVQYLTMDDYTKNFAQNAFPAIQELYRKNGHQNRVECRYFQTEHIYDKPKRQATYQWMQKWLNDDHAEVAEPETIAFPIPRLIALDTRLPASAKKLEALSEIYSEARKYRAPESTDRSQWTAYRDKQATTLRKLLGLDRAITPASFNASGAEKTEQDGVIVESFNLPVESVFQIPITVLRPFTGAAEALNPLIICSGDGRKKLLAESGPASAIELARSGHMVVLPDVRFFGDIHLDALIGVGPTSLMSFTPAYSQDEWLRNQDYSFHYHIQRAWQRNAIVWDRPLVGMIATDIRKVVDYLQSRPDVDFKQLRIIGKASSVDATYSVPLGVLFAAALDPRLKEIDVDLGGKSFEERSLPTVPFILWHGDVLNWAACVADRKLTLRNVSDKAGDLGWLKATFAHASSIENLHLIGRP
jgi:dienelactone hydrolase